EKGCHASVMQNSPRHGSFGGAMQRVVRAAIVLASAAAHSADLPTVVAIEHVAIIPMDRERIFEDFSVVVQGNRIAAIGPATSLEVPSGATRIDGRGKYLMPGIVENHAHMPGEQDPAANEIMALYALTGATTVRGMLGTPFQLELRRRIAAGEILGP